MKVIDVFILGGLLSITTCLILIPNRISHILKFLFPLLVVLAIIQLLTEGYYWHYVPSYVLLLLLLFSARLTKRFSSSLGKRFIQFAFVFFIMACMVPWATLAPIPKLTEPSGDYTVGTRIFRWVDPDRAEQITADMRDKRNVIVQAWYPAVENGKASHSDYIDGLDKLPEKIGFIPRWVFDHYDHINTYGVLNAPISKTQNHWPVIIFLTGNGASRAFYTSLVAGLASHGYVVLAIDHPYEAMITQLADGQIATTIEKHQADDPDLLKFMKERLDLRIADVKFVLNQAENPVALSDNFLSSLDKNRIVIAGHSLGGASAAAAMAVDSRIKAAANIDGTLYGELPEPKVAKPFLLIESKKDTSGRFVRYEEGNRHLFDHFGGGYRYEITEADHYSFTDAPFLLAFPARIFANYILKFGNIPEKTHRATVELLNTFFREALNENLADLDLVVIRYKGIIQKNH